MMTFDVLESTNTENNKSVIVRINDRGPFKKDRVIDLSFAAAYKLRLSDKGSGPSMREIRAGSTSSGSGI